MSLFERWRRVQAAVGIEVDEVAPQVINSPDGLHCNIDGNAHDGFKISLWENNMPLRWPYQAWDGWSRIRPPSPEPHRNLTLEKAEETAPKALAKERKTRIDRATVVKKVVT